MMSHPSSCKVKIIYIAGLLLKWDDTDDWSQMLHKISTYGTCAKHKLNIANQCSLRRLEPNYELEEVLPNLFLPRQIIKVKAFLHMVNSLQMNPPKKLIIWFQAFLQLSLSIYGIIIMPIILSILFRLLIPEVSKAYWSQSKSRRSISNWLLSWVSQRLCNASQ